MNIEQNSGEPAISAKVKGEEIAIHIGAREECDYITGIFSFILRA